MHALILGRFHAVTRGMGAWLEGLPATGVARVVGVITSADHSGTRRNPLPAATRAALLSPALARSGLPFDVVPVEDVPERADWVAHLLARVEQATGRRLEPAATTVFTANRDVAQLFGAAGFAVSAEAVVGLTPHELVQRVVRDQPWRDEATPETQAVYTQPETVAALRAIFSQTLVTDDGELSHQRDFASYGAQMDAALAQKLADLAPWVRPGCVVDKGCGTGSLLVELARLFPASRFVGVDLSREFLRRCDENTYAAEDVDFVRGNVADANVGPGAATTVIFSSVMHEVHSYSGYRREEVARALRSAFGELAPGGRLLVRDGVSPHPATWRLALHTAAAREAFERFAVEFKHGEGAPHERLASGEVRLSSHLANEFLCKKDYQQNWHIEVHEEFGPFTLPGWREALVAAGFLPLHLRELVNPWIATHRYEGQVGLSDDDGRALNWPATNCVVVGQKPEAK